MARINSVSTRKSLGTFLDHNTALAVVATLRVRENVDAVAERFMAGPFSDQPTDQYYVSVPIQYLETCKTWLRAWTAGREYEAVKAYGAEHCITHAEAARQLGYDYMIPTGE